MTDDSDKTRLWTASSSARSTVRHDGDETRLAMPAAMAAAPGPVADNGGTRPAGEEPAAGGGVHLPAGFRLRDYTISRVLGQGGFGITYLAHDTVLDREVVIKENLPATLSNRDTATYCVQALTRGSETGTYRWALDNFLKEARTLCKLKHPNIIQVLTAFSEMGTAYYVMPRIRGTSLDKVPAPMPEKQVRPILLAMLGALEYLHSLTPALLHRDIKPANILLRQDGSPVLIDFGTARALTEHTQSLTESPGYTPFEQVQTHGNTGPWTDLYALGGTMYHLLTGTKPPRSADRIRRTDSPEPLSGSVDLRQRYSPQLLASVDKALAIWPEDRWQSAAEWRDALADQAHAEPATATTRPAPGPAAGGPPHRFPHRRHTAGPGTQDPGPPRHCRPGTRRG